MRLILLPLICLALAHPVSAATLFLTTEIYPPYNVRSADGGVEGVFIDQLKILLDETDTEYQVSVMPWARAIALARTQSMHCAFAAARTPERENQFKWVSPILTDKNILIAKSTTPIDSTSLDKMRKYRVGTQRGDYTEKLLQSLGFANIDLGADFSITLNKLKAGRIDLMPMSEFTLGSLPAGEFKEVMTFSKQQFGLACHKSVPDTLIKKLQTRLNALITDGRQQKLFDRYNLNSR